MRKVGLFGRAPLAVLANLRKRDCGVAGVFFLQFACICFLIFEGVVDFLEIDHDHVEMLEAPFVLALVFGLGLSGVELNKLVNRQRRVNAQLKAASGAFGELLLEHFANWKLTPSESDVAMMAIKGLSIADIARLRQTKEGTIKAQCNAIYRKAGVTGRLQLLSVFIEELMVDSLMSPAAKNGHARIDEQLHDFRA